MVILKVESAFARSVGQSLHLAGIDKAAAVEDDFRDVLPFGAIGHQCSDARRGGNIGLHGLVARKFLFGRIDSGKGAARLIVDDLRIDVLARKVDGQTRPRRSARDLLPKARVPDLDR